jgi:heme/copper-type cytochrome/quinol oxidase subunit 3
MKFAVDGRTLLIGLWLGAACFFSFAVAPGAFAVLTSREDAGAVVNRTLAILNYAGMITGLILLASSFLWQQNVSRFRLRLEQAALLFLTAACSFGHFVVASRLSELRGQIGRPIDELAIDDPMRVAFNDLHGHSVMILIAAMISAVIAFFLIARRARDFENK